MPENDLRADYDAVRPFAEKMRIAVRDQLDALLQDNNITLGTPLESRVKTWDSLSEKLQRRSMAATGVAAIHDLIGLRLILLFSRDVDAVCDLISETFTIESFSDVGTRLDDTQFGYQSRHFVITLPATWLSMPTLKGVGSLQAEIQVRTVAQHIWAAASHKLQYKHEQSVPPPVRRAIHRVAALLETVDLEFERVLQGRESYRQDDSQHVNALLNVDNLSSTLAEMFPPGNKGDSEDYDDALKNLAEHNITTVDDLKAIISKNLEAVLKEEARFLANPKLGHTSKERRKRGVFFTHVGLLRSAIGFEVGGRFARRVGSRE